MDTSYRPNIRLVARASTWKQDLALILFAMVSGSLLCTFWLWAFFRAMERGWL